MARNVANVMFGFQSLIFAQSEKLNPNNFNCLSLVTKRFYAAPPKRFYRRTNVLHSDGQFEITLDQRKLKTPRGTIFKVDSEPLALAVAAEWDSQKEKIQQSNMHLTALCSTVIDNPNHLTKLDLVQHISNFLDTDTILFHSGEEEALNELQEKEWTPVIEWFCKRYGVKVIPTKHIGVVSTDNDSKATIQRHLMSYNFAAIHGFVFAMESLKSIILAHACVDRALSIEKAVLLSRLEEEYQTGYWGRVEWAHDLTQLDLQTRVAAAVLFIHLNSASEHTTVKRKKDVI